MFISLYDGNTYTGFNTACQEVVPQKTIECSWHQNQDVAGKDRSEIHPLPEETRR